MSRLKLKATEVFEKNFSYLNDDSIRFIANEGGSRSSKTYSLCQLIIVYSLKNPNASCLIVRESLSIMRETVMKDFFAALKDTGIYKKENHNKTESKYTFDNGSTVSFCGAQEEQKLRGRASDILWVDEANELSYESFQQLNMRCKFKVFVSYNPSETVSWLYELPPEKTVLIHSTYKDNPFLHQSQIDVIEAYKDTDDEMYQIYALGKRITPRQNVFSNWTFIPEKPERFKDYIIGMDHGYNHPQALVKVWYYENELFLEELIYERGMTTPDVIERMDQIGIDKSATIIADYARPEANEEIGRASYVVLNADKAVKEGINDVKSFKVFVHSSAKNIKKEYDNYKWKKHKDRILDEPIKLWDDAMDAIRYACRFIKKNLTSSAGGYEFLTFEY